MERFKELFPNHPVPTPLDFERVDYYELVTSPRSWAEDFHLDNGNYVNACYACKKYFLGYKRRIVCRSCAYPKPENPYAMMRGFLYVPMLAIFLISGFMYGFREILPVGLFILLCVLVGEAGQYFKKRKHRND